MWICYCCRSSAVVDLLLWIRCCYWSAAVSVCFCCISAVVVILLMLIEDLRLLWICYCCRSSAVVDMLLLWICCCLLVCCFCGLPMQTPQSVDKLCHHRALPKLAEHAHYSN
jgi:hypothetical protein